MSNEYFILNAIKNAKAAEENISGKIHMYEGSDLDSNVSVNT